MIERKIFLIPTIICETYYSNVFPEYNKKVIKDIKIFFVENIKSARRFLKRIIDENFDISSVEFFEINKRTTQNEILYYEKILQNNYQVGIMSEAGMPAIADPGALIVKTGHKYGYKIIPLIGPSSVFLALAASGLNGQRFRFLGYLTNKKDKLKNEIKEIERISKKFSETQIFIEAPYRNLKLFDQMLKNLSDRTLLCIACCITGKDEFILTKSVGEWKKLPTPSINKRNTIFLILA